MFNEKFFCYYFALLPKLKFLTILVLEKGKLSGIMLDILYNFIFFCVASLQADVETKESI